MPFFSTKKIGMNFDELLINLVWWVTGKAKVLTRRLWLETVWNKLGPNNLEVGKPSSFIFVFWKQFKVKIWWLTPIEHMIFYPLDLRQCGFFWWILCTNVCCEEITKSGIQICFESCISNPLSKMHFICSTTHCKCQSTMITTSSIGNIIESVIRIL